ncbi:type 1 glutamine amidotransferase domain-containing protein [Nocardia yamanashiensis]|uniref:type 1 glutamine amidotransferase domain-containing protein n=1 Tax=Nocardia yamanashiensis TaxID=209247 RepID=UPI001E426D15|nr:type 1 glutamine amidotransferase domain-containing protein [Nocardia yamanashiensis]UGT38750.1 type 1 glutamine amidotransferase domain-containing protein [Nocardia yamanashiensis]
MTKVLMVVTSNDRLGDSNLKTGLWASELTHAYEVFEKAGYGITLASIKGGRPPLDPFSEPDSDVSVEKEDQVSRDFFADPVKNAAFGSTAKLADLNPDDYDVIFYTGGTGTMWDFPDDPDVQRFARRLWDNGKIVSAVCHGSSALTNVTLADGSYLVAGRRVTGFSDAEEKVAEDNLTKLGYKFVPWYVQDRLIERGGIYDEGAPYSVHVVADGNLITGQQNSSGGALAEAIVEKLSA